MSRELTQRTRSLNCPRWLLPAVTVAFISMAVTFDLWLWRSHSGVMWWDVCILAMTLDVFHFHSNINLTRGNLFFTLVSLLLSLDNESTYRFLLQLLRYISSHLHLYIKMQSAIQMMPESVVMVLKPNMSDHVWIFTVLRTLNVSGFNGLISEWKCVHPLPACSSLSSIHLYILFHIFAQRVWRSSDLSTALINKNVKIFRWIRFAFCRSRSEAKIIYISQLFWC